MSSLPGHMLFGIQVRPAVGPGLTPNPFCIDIIRMQGHALMLYFSKTGQEGWALAESGEPALRRGPLPNTSPVLSTEENRIHRQLVPKLSPQLWAGTAGRDGGAVVLTHLSGARDSDQLGTGYAVKSGWNWPKVVCEKTDSRCINLVS